MFGFLIALVAGFLTPHAEAPLARPLARVLGPHVVVEEAEMRLFSFMLMLLIAGVLCAVFHTGSPLGVALGAVLGYFAIRILGAGQRLLDNRR